MRKFDEEIRCSEEATETGTNKVIMRIAIDLDDTLSRVDRMKGVERYLNEAKLPFVLKNRNAHVLQDMYDWTRKDVDEFIRAGGVTVFTDAPPRDDARETLRGWKEAGHEIIILTARIPEWFGDPVEVSRVWLDKHGMEYDAIVANVWEKGEYCREHGIDVLIEDNFEICEKAQSLGVNSVLFVDVHNEKHAEEITYHGKDWQEIASQIDAIGRAKAE